MKERLKEPREGSERDPKTLCLQTVKHRKMDRVLFVERSGELCNLARLSMRTYGAEAKASLNRASSQIA